MEDWFQRYNSPRWAGSNEHSDKCQICDKAFGFFKGFTKSQHHCRRCGMAVCDNCSNNSEILDKWLDDNKPHSVHTENSSTPLRVCDYCHNYRANPPNYIVFNGQVEQGEVPLMKAVNFENPDLPQEKIPYNTKVVPEFRNTKEDREGNVYIAVYIPEQDDRQMNLGFIREDFIQEVYMDMVKNKKYTFINVPSLFGGENIGEPEYHTVESAKRKFAYLLNEGKKVAAFTFTGDSNAEDERLVEFKNTVEIGDRYGDSYYMNYI